MLPSFSSALPGRGPGVSAMTMPFAAQSDSVSLAAEVVEPKAKRAYVAPALTELGSVEELTQGSGSSVARDARAVTRRVG